MPEKTDPPPPPPMPRESRLLLTAMRTEFFLSAMDRLEAVPNVVIGMRVSGPGAGEAVVLCDLPDQAMIPQILRTIAARLESQQAAAAAARHN